MNGRALVVALILALGVSAAADSAFAQPIEHGRGNIVSIDQDRGTVELRDPKNRVTTWRFQRDAQVKFTDGAGLYPNPSVRDLRPPMYVHYMSVNQVINSFDVVELGFKPGSQDTGGMYKKQGISRTVTGKVTAYDPRVRQVAVDHHGLNEAFQLTDRTDQKLQPGMQIELRTDWSGQQELVSSLRVISTPDARDDRGRRDNRDSSNDRSRRRHSGDRDDSGSSAEGRVVRINSRGVVMDVAGTRVSYVVADSRLLDRLQVGDSVRFNWEEDDDGQLVITNIR